MHALGMSHKDNYNKGDRDHSNNPGANHGSPDDKPGDGRRNGSQSGGGESNTKGQGSSSEESSGGSKQKD